MVVTFFSIISGKESPYWVRVENVRRIPLWEILWDHSTRYRISNKLGGSRNNGRVPVFNSPQPLVWVTYCYPIINNRFQFHLFSVHKLYTVNWGKNINWCQLALLTVLWHNWNHLHFSHFFLLPLSTDWWRGLCHRVCHPSSWYPPFHRAARQSYTPHLWHP